MTTTEEETDWKEELASVEVLLGEAIDDGGGDGLGGGEEGGRRRNRSGRRLGGSKRRIHEDDVDGMEKEMRD